MLVKELKALEANGIIQRTAYATVPPTVEYTLTPMGKNLKPVFSAIQKWALEHL